MITLAKQAMATRFELVLPGDSPRLRAAGEEALNEIARVEAMLSLYRDSSEVALLNRRAAAEPVRVSNELFQLLERAVALAEETEGAFDITIAPLVRAWGFMIGQGSRPTREEVAIARENVGSGNLELDATTRTVRFAKPGVMLDFGAFGKGYAVDCAIDLLRENGVAAALLHGGTSTVYGLGLQPDGSPWKIAIEGAPREDLEKIRPDAGNPISNTASILAVVELQNKALSVSAVWGKSFASQGRTFGHILDARTGEPSQKADLAALALDSSADSDALSTALLVDGAEGLPKLLATRKNARALVFADGKTLSNF